MTKHTNREPYAGPLVSRKGARAAGLPRYFTGKPCPRGHICQRKTYGCTCVYCDIDLNIQYLAERPELVVAFKERQATGLVIPMAVRSANRQGDPSERNRRRKARKLASQTHYTEADMDEIFQRQRGRCAICGERVSENDRSDDHIISLEKGGTNDKSNMQVTHIRCNQSKGSRDPIEHNQRRTRNDRQPKLL